MYQIHEVPGDTPYVWMKGNYSMEELQVVLAEMQEVYNNAGCESQITATDQET